MALLFIHIPKTAGLSLLDAIRSARGRHRVLTTHDGNVATAFADWRGRDLRDTVCYGHFAFGAHNVLSLGPQYATMVRNPVARVVSMYHYLLQSPQHPDHNFATSNTLMECVETRIEFRNQQARMIAGYDFKFDDQQALADKAIANLEKCFGAVGTTESFDESLVIYAQRFHWSKSPCYARRNKSRHGDWRELPDRVLLGVREANKADLAVYDYCVRRLESDRQRIEGFEQKLSDFRRHNRLRGALLKPLLVLRDLGWKLSQSIAK